MWIAIGVGLTIALSPCTLFGEDPPTVLAPSAESGGFNSTITVSFNQQQGAADPVGVGFLLLGPGVDPPDEMIEPLRPRLWRMHLLDPVRYDRITGFGAKYQFIMSELVCLLPDPPGPSPSRSQNR